MVAPGSEGQHEQHGTLLRERKELLEEQYRRRIGPVQVLDCEHDGRLLREACEELADDLERPPLQGLGRQLRRAGRRVVFERDSSSPPRYG